MAISKDATAWAIRLLLGHEPDDALIEFHRHAYNSVEDLRTAFLQAPEAKELFGAANNTPPAHLNYLIPPFILRRPAYADIPWDFREPSIENPVSQLCTSEQMSTPAYRLLCERLTLNPSSMHRKVWEFVYILSVLENKGMVKPGKRGLGFGTGREPLPSVFAKAGADVTATDAPSDLEHSAAWEDGAQWAKGLEDLWHSKIVDREAFFHHVQFRPADMNKIPEELAGFDFCWSSCCFEHLGSIRHGLDFLKKCLATLKPGGVSVHTTEFNLSSNADTLEHPMLVVFRKTDIEQIIHELVQEGHTVEPLNLWPGSMPVDEHIDLPPYGPQHLKLQLLGSLTTSIGIVVTKKS